MQRFSSSLAGRAARVVAWLEALAAEALDEEAALMAAGGATAGRFGATEGVWAETRLRLAAGVSRHGDQQLVCGRPKPPTEAPWQQRAFLPLSEHLISGC